MPKHVIYTPSGKSFEIRTDPSIDARAIRDFMATAKAVSLDIVADDKPATLILWGETLSNSHIIITE